MLAANAIYVDRLRQKRYEMGTDPRVLIKEISPLWLQ